MKIARLTLETPEQAGIAEPVDLAFVKEHLHVSLDIDDDYIFALIAAARSYVETYTRRALIARTGTLVLAEFPSWEIVLPYGAAVSLTNIVYRDSSAAIQTLDGSASPEVVQTDFTDPDQAIVTPLRDSSWPGTDPMSIAPITVTWEAGYGTSPEDVPHVLRLGIARQIGRWFESRSNLEEASVAPEFVNLLEPYRIIRGA